MKKTLIILSLSIQSLYSQKFTGGDLIEIPILDTIAINMKFSQLLLKIQQVQRELNFMESEYSTLNNELIILNRRLKKLESKPVTK